MVFWTIQHKKVIDVLNDQGEYYPSFEKSPQLHRNTYNKLLGISWFQKEMTDKYLSDNELRRRCIIPDGVSLKFEDFPTFARTRKFELINRFRQILA